jgi:hypothetical protein
MGAWCVVLGAVSVQATSLTGVTASEQDTVPGTTPLNVNSFVTGPTLSTIAYLAPGTPATIQHGDGQFNSAVGQIYAIARPGGALGAQANINSAEINMGTTGNVAFGASSYYEVTDLLISPTAGSTFHNGDLIHTSFRLDVHGTLFTDGTESQAEAAFTIAANPSQGGASPGNLGGTYEIFTEALNANTYTSFVDRNGMFADPGQTDSRTDGTAQTLTQSVGGTLTTLPFAVFVGTPFTLDFQVAASAVVGSSGAGFDHYLGSAQADFADTVLFAQSGGVMDLPTGLTLNSAQASIVNNVAAPEPVGGVLLSAAMLLAVRRRRRAVADATVY